MSIKCEVCGQRVKVYSGKGGTNSYEGVDAEEVVSLKKDNKIAHKVFGCESDKLGEIIVELKKENKRVSWQLDQAIKRAVGYCKEIEKLRESDAHREMENFSLKKKLDRVTVEGIKSKLCNMGVDITTVGAQKLVDDILGFPANKELKQLRMKAHRELEKYFGKWETMLKDEKKAMYIWLKDNTPTGHIGSMNAGDIDDLLKKLEDL